MNTKRLPSKQSIRATIRSVATPVAHMARRGLGNDQMLDQISSLRDDLGARVGYLTTIVEAPAAGEPVSNAYYEQLLGMLADELDRTRSELAQAVARIDRLEAATKKTVPTLPPKRR
jgi:hypothetical protein